MSTRKNTTVTGCKGRIIKKNKWGSLIDVHEEKHSCSECVLKDTMGCQDFRMKSGFERIRVEGI